MKKPIWCVLICLGCLVWLVGSCSGEEGALETTWELEILVSQEKSSVSENNPENTSGLEQAEEPQPSLEVGQEVHTPEEPVRTEPWSQEEEPHSLESKEDAAEQPEFVVEPGGGESVQDMPPQDTGNAVCPTGMFCVAKFPYQHHGDTRQSSLKKWDRYSCQTSANEGGPEVVYRVDVKKAGFLSAAVFVNAGVDVDVHILSQLDAATCLSRGDKHAKADVQPGVYYVVVDTFVSGGKELSGAYRVDIGWYEPSQGPCEMQSGIMKRVNDGDRFLQMPATGPVVMEAHLVTQDEPPPYPKTSTDKLSTHYDISQHKTGFVMHRTQVWAPLEGGSFYGAGIGSPTLFPLLDESWYVNMYWRSESRPARGTRMILRIPGTSRAVVVAAGYETGPGDLNNIGGTTEETHFYLGTGHKSTLTLGIAKDQSLPFGPRICR